MHDDNGHRDGDKARLDDKGHIEREKEGTMIRTREREMHDDNGHRDGDKARHDDKGHIEREKEGTKIRARERDAR